MRNILLGLAVVASTLITGCSTRVADLTVVSTKNANLNSDQFVTGKRVTGKDTKYIISFIPTGTPSIKEAVDQAIEQDACAVALSNMAMDHEFFWFPYIFGITSYRAEGNLVIDKAIPGCESWSNTVTPPLSK